MSLLLAALLLSPVLADDGELRLVAAGTGDAPTAWILDGVEVARSGDREPVHVAVAAGRHELWAVSGARGAWTAMARPEPEPGEGAQYVSAWTATQAVEPRLKPPVPRWVVPAALALGGALLAWPRRRSKSP